MSFHASTPRPPKATDALHAAAVACEALISAGFDALMSHTVRTGTPVRTAGNGAVQLDALVYELLDAHADTADLGSELQSDPRWAAHLDYLRALQRTGREVLAHASRENPA